MGDSAKRRNIAEYLGIANAKDIKDGLVAGTEDEAKRVHSSCRDGSALLAPPKAGAPVVIPATRTHGLYPDSLLNGRADIHKPVGSPRCVPTAFTPRGHDEGDELDARCCSENFGVGKEVAHARLWPIGGVCVPLAEPIAAVVQFANLRDS
jgi:hypothetical protein